MSRLQRLRETLVGLVATILVLASCELFEPEAALQVDLNGTNWVVTEVDGRSVASEPEITVAFVGASAIASTECGDRMAGFDLDASGSAMNLGPFDGGPSPCPAEISAWESEVVRVLDGVEEWRVLDKNLIELINVIDSRVVRLERMLPTPSGGE